MVNKDNTPAVIEQSELSQRIYAAGEVTSLDGAAIAEKILQRILDASTVAEVLMGITTVQAETILGLPLTVRDVHFNESTTGQGEGIYAVIDCTVAGRPCAVTCGSRTVMAQLFKLKELGAFPLRVCITRSQTKTAAGFYPMQLEAVGDDVSDRALPEEATDAGVDDEPF